MLLSTKRSLSLTTLAANNNMHPSSYRRVTLLLSFLLLLFSLTNGFLQQQPLSKRRVLLVSMSSTIDTSTATSTTVSLVSVCTAELCQCQGDDDEDRAADALLHNLQQRNLPYEVHESTCLGACGMGTMVAIDYDDGSADLVAGLDETLVALGIHHSTDIEHSSSGANAQDVMIASPTTTLMVPSADVAVSKEHPAVRASNSILPQEAPSVIVVVKNQPAAVDTSIKTIAPSTTTTKNQKQPPRTAIPDARDRMRQEAAADDASNNSSSNSNPWFQVAGYLAKKVMGADDE